MKVRREVAVRQHAAVRAALVAASILLLGVARIATAQAASPGDGASAGPVERLIVLGFDGADPALLEKYMAAGELPGFKALGERGVFRRLQSTSPAQSPVSWSSIITGLNPGKTGIFGFVQLDDRRKGVPPRLRYTLTGWKDHPLPSTGNRIYMSVGAGLMLGLLIWVLVRIVGFRSRVAISSGLIAGGALAVASSYFLFALVPESLVATTRIRDGKPFYQILAEQGHPAVALEAPMDAPPPAVSGLRVLSGLGVPDIAGGDSSWAVYTSEVLPVRRTPTGGRVVLLESLEGRNDVELRGPPDPFVRVDLERLERMEVHDFEAYREHQSRVTELRRRLHTTVKLSIHWRPGDREVGLTLPGSETVTLSPGTWSDFLPVTFRAGALVAYRGLVRFHVDRADAQLRLYQEPIAWDPRFPNPQVPLSHPPGYVSLLAKQENVGLFETMGWACATNAFRDRMIGEKAFVEDVMDGMRRREAMLRHELEQKDWRCLFAVFTGVDRLQHMLWRHLDGQHPAHRAGDAASGKRALLDMYKAMDRIVSMVAEFYLNDRTALIVLSDHGFASYRWKVNLNTWLERQGYLVVKGNQRPTATFERPFPGIDWDRTRAFAYGLGQIRINLRGRDGAGASGVDPASYGALVTEIAERLMQLEHAGTRVVHRVDTRDAIYDGPHLEVAPDLLPGFVRGYRVSGATIYGEVPARVFEPNEALWSGDHCSVAPDLVPGIFLASMRLGQAEVRAVDIAPTLLALLGVDPASHGFDGRALVPTRP
jgi:predicted AlkP superfamily phosphohydrolase/phosphomutase